jgi:hypothetical protein
VVPEAQVVSWVWPDQLGRNLAPSKSRGSTHEGTRCAARGTEPIDVPGAFGDPRRGRQQRAADKAATTHIHEHHLVRPRDRSALDVHREPRATTLQGAASPSSVPSTGEFPRWSVRCPLQRAQRRRAGPRSSFLI